MGTIEDYRTVTGTFEDEMSLKGSRFIGIVMPCPSESDISASIETVMKKYPNATHYCSKCGATAAATSAFCGKCGGAVVANNIPTCPNCGAIVKEGAAFCGGCGTKLQ